MEHFRVALRESRRSLGPLRQASLLGKHAVPPQFSQQLCTRARVSRSTIQTDAISRWQMRPRLFRLQRPSFQRYNSTAPEAPSLTARLRKLFREYGYTAVGVYAALLVLDLPFCYLAVKWLGAERIQHWEDVVVGGAKDILRIPFPNLFEDKNEDDAPSAITAEMDEADKEAEKGGLSKLNPILSGLSSAYLHSFISAMDDAWTCFSGPQVVYFRESAIDGSIDSQSSQDTTRSGMGHWQKKAQREEA